jgi:pyruvate/2-oxoglutarate dehydrogenase complex dihydrolipoamide dehydrogenase (E3) component
MKFTHDVIVIGGGAGGLTAAGGCALFGLKVALIEGHKMGGECLNNGCVPSKALLAAAKRAAVARKGERMGVRIAPPEIDWSGVKGQVRRAIADIEHHDSVETFEEMGCEVILGHARLTGKHSVEVAGQTLQAPRIVLATGSRPFVPPIEGVDGVPYLTNENVFELDEQPGHLVIVGGGNIGMEMAQAFRRLGSEVTVIEPDAIMGRDDRDSVAVMVEALREEGVRFVHGKAKAVSGAAGSIRLEIEGAEAVEGSHLLIATGRTARVEGFGPEELGLKLGRNGFAVDKRRRTSLRSIYAIGDCRDGIRLTHVAGYEGSKSSPACRPRWIIPRCPGAPIPILKSPRSA